MAAFEIRGVQARVKALDQVAGNELQVFRLK